MAADPCGSRDKEKLVPSKNKRSQYQIHGTITDAAAEAIGGADVIARWKRLRADKQVAAGSTSSKGAYRLAYDISPEAPASRSCSSRQAPRLGVQLSSGWLDAVPDLEVNLRYAVSDPSGYTAILGAITALLENFAVADLVETGQSSTGFARRCCIERNADPRVRRAIRCLNTALQTALLYACHIARNDFP
jgi:hypothetical protein